MINCGDTRVWRTSKIEIFWKMHEVFLFSNPVTIYRNWNQSHSTSHISEASLPERLPKQQWLSTCYSVSDNGHILPTVWDLKPWQWLQQRTKHLLSPGISLREISSRAFPWVQESFYMEYLFPYQECKWPWQTFHKFNPIPRPSVQNTRVWEWDCADSCTLMVAARGVP